MQFTGKVAIITGAGGALGRIVSRRFLEEGALVAAPFRRGTAPENSTFALRADLTVEGEVEAFTSAVKKKFGRIDFAIHLSGGYAGGKFVEDLSLADWEQMLGTNLLSTFLLCRAVLPWMKEQRSGRIVAIAAMPALRPAARKAAYAVSKAGVVSLIQSIAQEVKGLGITANALAPGTILTEENLREMPGADTSGWVPPEEIAKTISALCSDDGRSINGTVIPMFDSYAKKG